MECFLIKYLQIGNAAINRRDECLCKMKELFTSIRRTMRCVIVLQVTAHQRPTQLHKRWVCCSVLRAAGGEVVTRLAEVESGVRGAGAGTHWHWNTGTCCWVHRSASKSCIRRFVITEKAPTRAFSWLKAATTAFSFKTLLRHYANRALTPQSLNVKLGPRHKSQKGRAGWLA